MPIEDEVGRMTDHEPLQAPRLRMQARQLHQLALDLFPVAQRINQQALPVPVDRDHQLALRSLQQALAIACRDDHASPLSPTYRHYRNDELAVSTPEGEIFEAQ